MINENNKRQIVLLYLMNFLLSLTSIVQGQQIEIVGNVLDAYEHSAISNAQVVLLKKSDSTIVAFTVTSSNGKFQLNKKVEQTPKEYYLRVAYIGYADAIFTQLYEGLNELDIKLEPKIFELPEINISVDRPIRQNNDTISFQVDFYNKQGEQNIEELLKNMPNFRVDEDGSIYFKNNRISKVFIEGENLAGNSYQILTRSLDPLVLDKVQVLEKFSENQLIRDLDNQKQTILNLTIKEERKKLLFGNTHIKVGNYYDGLVSLISILNKSKQLLVTSVNNVGIKRGGLFNQQTQQNDPTHALLAPSLYNFNNFYTKQLNSNVENINNEQVLRYALATTIHPKLKLNFDVDAYKDTNNNFREENTTFFTQNNFSLSQSDTLQNNPSGVALGLKMEYMPREKTRVYLNSKVLSARDMLLQDLLFFSDSRDNRKIKQNYNTDKKSSFNHVEITNKINDYQVLHIELDQGWSSNKDNYYTNYLLGDLWFFATNSMDSLSGIFSQSISSERYNIKSQLKWYYGRNNFKFHSLASFSNRRDQYNLSSDYTRYKLNNINQEIKWSQVAFYRSNHLEANFSLDLARVRQSISNEENLVRHLLLPSLIINYKLPNNENNITHAIVGTFKKDYQKSIDWALIDSPLFLDFRTAQVGDNTNLLINQNSIANLAYLYFDIFRYLTFNINLFLIKRDNWDFNHYTLQSDFSWAQLLNLKNLGSEGLNIKVEKSLYTIRGNVKLELETMVNHFQNIVNQNERNIKNRLLSSSILYRSSFNFPLNIEFSYNILHNKYFFFTNNGFYSENSFYNTKLNTMLFFNHSRISARVNGELTTIAQNRIWLFNGQIEYKLKSYLKLSVNCFNGLNKKSCTLLNVNPISRTTTQYALLERSILIGVQFNF